MPQQINLVSLLLAVCLHHGCDLHMGLRWLDVEAHHAPRRFTELRVKGEEGPFSKEVGAHVGNHQNDM